jgi:hypothetical protein
MTAGLITGDGTVSGDGSAGLGRLVERGSPTPGFGEPTSDDCVGQVPGDSDGYVDITLGKTTYSINNDTLACFITNNTTRIKDFANGSYSGPPVLSPDIYCSPRFFWVPIVPTQPANGQSLTYPIQQFRPAFITYQNLKGDLEDTHLNGPDPDPNNPLNKNGLAAPPNNGGKLQSVSIIFFNANALPASAGTSKCTPEIGQWLGGDTPKVPLLKN